MGHEGQILHELEEMGQSRKEELSETLVVACQTGLRAVGTSILWGTVITGGRLLFGDDVTLLSAAVTYGTVWAIRFGLSIEGDIDEHREGLRSEKVARSYAPTPPAPEPVAVPSSPIVVKPYGRTPYVLPPDNQPMLPDGRNVQLGLNPPTLAAVLAEVLNQHDGQWSRQRLMSIRVNGQRVTRNLYEEFTDALCRAGFLQERSTGGYEVPADVRSFQDLSRYFPRLPGLSQEGGRAGGKAGGRETGGPAAIPPPGGGVTTIAQRRQQKWLELGCDAAAYLEWRRNDGHI